MVLEPQSEPGRQPGSQHIPDQRFLTKGRAPRGGTAGTSGVTSPGEDAAAGAAEGCGSMGRAKGHPSLAVCGCAGNGGSRERRALAERVFFFWDAPAP